MAKYRIWWLESFERSVCIEARDDKHAEEIANKLEHMVGKKRVGEEVALEDGMKLEGVSSKYHGYNDMSFIHFKEK